jgi:hypothetical protein
MAVLVWHISEEISKYVLIRILNKHTQVRNLPFKITAEEMYDIFGKYGAIRQIRL